MLIKIAAFLVVFIGVFYLTNLFYPVLENFLKRWQQKRMGRIAPKLDRMFLDISLKRIMLLDILTPFLSGLFGYFLTNKLTFALGFMAVGFIVPFLIVRKLEAIRREKFSSQLVDGLMILSSSLKAGLSLLQSFEVLVEEMPAPICQEFGLVIRQMQMGVSLEEALANLKKRIRVDELDMVVTATMVARETGGDLTQTFGQLVYAIQERKKLIGRVNALCVQAKLQGAIMSILPILFGIFVYKINPHFFDIFLADNFGKGLLYYAGISEILGIFFIRKLSKIDI